ncbi:hypothetical protein GF337_18380 [candidate division KSB1 bacterium]|nr:hypothetical protein [candidate division KSB1 bacterium]
MKKFIFILLLILICLIIFIPLKYIRISIPIDEQIIISTNDKVYLISDGFVLKRLFNLKDKKIDDEFKYIKYSKLINPDTLFLYIAGEKYANGHFVKLDLSSRSIVKSRSPSNFKRIKLKDDNFSLVGIENKTNNLLVLDHNYNIQKKILFQKYLDNIKSLSSRKLPEPSLRYPSFNDTSTIDNYFVPFDLEINGNNILIAGFGTLQLIKISENGEFILGKDLYKLLNAELIKGFDFITVNQINTVGNDKIYMLATLSSKWDAGPVKELFLSYDFYSDEIISQLTSENISEFGIYKKPHAIFDLFRNAEKYNPSYFNFAEDHLFISNNLSGELSNILIIDKNDQLIFQFPKNYLQDLFFSNFNNITYIGIY